MRRIFENGRIVLPGGVAQGVRLLAEGDRILDPAFRGERPEGEIVDLEGGWLLPGFVDLHLHGGDGADFMDGSPEAFRRACMAHCRCGTTSLCPTTVACGREELLRLFDVCRGAGDTGADILGLHLEGPYISQEFRGAQPEQFVRNPDSREIDEILERAGGLIVRWSSAPELPGMEALAEKLRECGILCAVAHSAATCEEVAVAFGWGFTHITHLYSSTPSVRKLNQRVHAGVIEAAYLLDDMTVELIGDGRHVPKELMQTVVKLKGPERVALITDAMRAAGSGVTESFLGNPADGNRVIIEDGVAKLPDRSFFAGSIATADHVFRNAVTEYGFPPEAVSQMMSGTPAKILGRYGELGSLSAGKRTDLVVMNRDFQIQRVYVRGRLMFAKN